MTLLGLLYFNNEALSICPYAFHIHPDVLAIRILVSALLRGILDRHNLSFGDKSLKEKQHQSFGVSKFLERPLEPFVEQNVGINPMVLGVRIFCHNVSVAPLRKRPGDKGFRRGRKR